jgi:alpha-glucosidase
MNLIRCLLFGLFVLPAMALAKEYPVSSLDKQTRLSIRVSDQITFQIFYKDNPVIPAATLALELGTGEILGNNPVVSKTSRQSVNRMLVPVLKDKRARIPEVYNELVIRFRQSFAIEFRVYNDGVAYRFVTQKAGELIVRQELARYQFPVQTRLTFPFVNPRSDADQFHTSFEENFTTALLDTVDKRKLMYSPVLAHLPDSLKVVVTESDLIDYPGMFLQAAESNSLSGVFAPYPKSEKVMGDGFRQSIVTERETYIAKTVGSRSFPWRILAIAPTDASILTNDIVYRLASPGRLQRTDWIKPGQSTEEWITDLNLYGVDFKAGLNTATYKYYVDFAERFSLEYVMLDAGWSDVNDLFKPTPGLDVKEVIRYADAKNIGIILWTQAETLNRQLTVALDSFKLWGVKLVMTDFIDRDDQKAIAFMHRFADEAARRELMVMIHGAPKPAGFSRTHPNALTRESVAGSEYNAWSARIAPEHDLHLPFLRMFSGPMDYEPGLLQNATRRQSGKLGMEKVIAQGTVMHQMAMFVIYESPLQLFSGNLSDAIREPELMTFFGKLPTVWDETRIIEARFADYILEARRNGQDWFVGGINDWTARDFTLTLDFLGEGTYEATLCMAESMPTGMRRIIRLSNSSSKKATD